MANKKSAGVGKKTQASKARASAPAGAGSDSVAEAAAWSNVQGLASSALEFWNSFIGLRSGPNPLDAGGLARLTLIIRAVSWVESQHGTGAGISSAVDPMQCGNPRDAWWKELTDR